MKLLSSLVALVGATRVNELQQAPDLTSFKLSPAAVTQYATWSADQSVGLVPDLVPQGETLNLKLNEHSNFFKTSEYSISVTGRNDKKLDTPVRLARFHTYLLGKSTDLRVGKQGQRKRLFRVTSHRHGNALNNMQDMVFYVKDRKGNVFYTIARARVKAFGFRGNFLALGKIMTHVQRKGMGKKNDIFRILYGKCPFGGSSFAKEPKCGKMAYTGVAAFNNWAINWYEGDAKELRNNKLSDKYESVADLAFEKESWGKASLHKKQVWQLNVRKGDTMIFVITAVLNDIIRAQEAVNLKPTHNFFNMDMR